MPNIELDVNTTGSEYRQILASLGEVEQPPRWLRADEQPDLEAARNFLAQLDPAADRFFFQVIDNRPTDPCHVDTRTFYGDLASVAGQLADWNRKGFGVYVTVNETVGDRRRKQDIKRVRAVFRELDQEDEWGWSFNIEPSLVVETSPGKRHEWFFVDGLSLLDFEGVQRFLVHAADSDPNARDLSRVLRVPGFYHMKSEPCMVRVIKGAGVRYTAEQITAAFPPIRFAQDKNQIDGDMEFSPAAYALVESWIAAIPGDVVKDRDSWLKYGVALARLGDEWFNNDFKDLRLDLWQRLSVKAQGYENGDTGCAEKWDDRLRAAADDRGRKATYKTLLWAASQNGWALETSGLASDHLYEARKIINSARGLPDFDSSEFVEILDEENSDGPLPTERTSSRRKMQAEGFKEAVEKALTGSARPLIKGLLDEGAMSIFYGDSNTGKTFTTLDLAFCVATGRPWNGKRTIRGLVVYVAAEGGMTILRRLSALNKRYAEQHDGEVAEPLFSLVRYPIDLRTNDVDLKFLVEIVREEERKYGAKCAWVIVDTLSRAMAGGDENGSVDMGRVVKAADRIREETGAHFTYVHHTGKDTAKGARGHSLLRAATDTEIEVTPTKIEVTKQRDMECGYMIGFKLVDVPLGCDRDGTLIKSAMVEWEAVESEAEEQADANDADVRLLVAIHELPNSKQAEWAAASNIKGGSIHKKLGRLKREKLVEGAKGHYWLTAKGKKIVSRSRQMASTNNLDGAFGDVSEDSRWLN